MAGPDWNWFYSSLAQCGAAVVAVGTAFYLGNVQSEFAQFVAARDRLRRLIIEAQAIQAEGKTLDIGWYNSIIAAYNSGRLAEMVRPDAPIPTAESLMPLRPFSPYSQPDLVLTAIKDMLSRLSEMRPGPDWLSSRRDIVANAKLTFEGHRSRAEHVRQQIDDVRIRARLQADLLRDFLESAVPGLHATHADAFLKGGIPVLLLVLALFSVAMPLVLLPSAVLADAAQISAVGPPLIGAAIWWRIACVAPLLLALGVLVVFAWGRSRQVCFAPELLDDAKTFTELAAYCPHFALFEENARARSVD